MLTLGNKLTLNSQPIYHFVNKYSIDFDGSDQRIVTDGADTVLQNSTYSFWCKSSTTASNKGIFGHGGQQIGSFHFNFDGSKPLLYLGTNLWVYWNDTSAQDDGEWHHWVVYSEPNDLSNCKLYVDGVLQTVSSIESSGSLNAYTESLTIGSERQVGGDSFEGKIDEFAVFDRELTQAEITRMYNTYYSPNRVANGNFSQIGNEEVTNGDFSQEGSELVVNGDFDTASNWIVSTGWSIQNGYAESDGTNSPLDQTGILTIGKQYKVVITVENMTANPLSVRLGSSSSNQILAITSNGTYTAYGVAGGDRLRLRSQGFNGRITNVSVKEVLQDWSITGSGVASIVDGALNYSNTVNGSWFAQFISQAVSFVQNKIYKVTFKAKNISGAVNLRITHQSHIVFNDNLTSSFVDYTVYYTAQANNDSIRIFCNDAIGEFQIDNITIKEVGQHWDFGTGWSTDGTKAISDGTLTSSDTLLQNFDFVDGATYKFTFTILDYVSGGVYIREPYNGYLDVVSANGTYSFNYVAGLSNNIQFRSDNNFTGSIDNIVVQELKHDATNLMLNAGAYQSANPLITSTKSMEFDGTDTTLEANNELSSGTYSFSAWVKRDTIPSVWQYIVDFRRGNTSSQYVAYNSTGGFGTGAGSDIVYVDGVASSTAPNDTKWHHIVVTGLSVANSSKINIGSRYTGLEAMDGKITEVGTWDRTLTALEVASLYNQGMPTNLLVNRNNYQSGNPTVFNTKQVDFDGTDDYLDLGSQSATSSLTYSAWVYCEGNNSNIFSYGKTIFRCSNTTELKYWSDITQSNITLTVDDYFNKWTHFVVTQTGTTYAIYQNGIQKSTGTVAAISTTQDNSYIGRFSTQYFNGKISQVGIFNEALTADEVSSLYNHGLPIDLTTNQAAYESSSNLVGYWRMGSGTLDSYPLIADQTNATLGSELVTNGDFTNGTNGWSAAGIATINIVNGELEVNVTGGGGGFLRTSNIPCVDGRTYLVSIDYRAGTYVGDVSPIIDGVAQDLITPTSVTQTETWKIVANGSSFQLSFVRSAAYTGTIYYDNVSVKEIGGNPAIMTNQTSSDIENGSPYANIVQNGTFDTDSDWTKQNGSTISGGVGNVVANGSISSDYLNWGLYQNNIFNPLKNYKVKFRARQTSGSGNFQVAQSWYIMLNQAITSSFVDYSIDFTTNSNVAYTYLSFGGDTIGDTFEIDNVTVEEVNTGLQGYWKMGDGTNDEYPIIYDQTNPTLGSEVVTNGDFATNTDWTLLGDWEISGGSLNIVGGINNATQGGVFETGKFYKFEFDIVVTSGYCRVYFGSSGTTIKQQISTSGHYIIYGIAESPTLTFRSATTTDLSIDNVSVKEVQGNPATMTNMLEGNITNQYPLTKIRNYYRMGDGILDGYPIIQDQTSPNLAHIPTTNLIEHSERFTNGYDWTVQSGITVTDNFATAPNGTQTASKVIGDGTLGLYQIKSITGNVARSVYLKSITGNVNVILKDPALTVTQKTCNLTTEWQRFELSEDNGHGSQSGIWIDDIPASGIYIWGAQLEAQSQATAYLKSDGIAAVRKATTTNLIPYSEDFSGYTIGGITLTSQTETSPINTNDATLVTFTSGGHYLRKDVTVTANTVYTLSFYVKRGTATGLKYRMRDITNNVDILAPTSYYSETSNDWKRIQVTVTTPATCTTLGAYVFSDGGSTGTVFLWGVQLEQQTQAETYAKTTGLPVEIDLFTENNYGTMTNMSASDIIEDTPNN